MGPPELAEIVERCRQIDTVAAVLLFLKVERFKETSLCKLQPALRLMDLRDVVQRNGDHYLCLSGGLPEDVERAAENFQRLRLSQLAMTKVAELHADHRRIDRAPMRSHRC